MHHPTPRVVLSKCLELEACRYNGQSIRAPIVTQLDPHVEFVPTCPEVEIGLGIPRDPIRLVTVNDTVRLIQPSTERDLTTAMQDFSRAFLGGRDDVDGFILKSRSPSCGIKDTKIHASGSQPSPVGKGPGMFGQAVLDRFPRAAIEDEGRLTNMRLRHHFLTRLFTNARMREMRARNTMSALVEFHTRHKFLLMAHHQQATRALGRIVAEASKPSLPDALDAYENKLAVALGRPARTGSVINAFMHALGYVSDGLSAREKAHFLGVLADYREGRVSLQVPLAMIQSWVARFEQQYLDVQVFLEPYPTTLVNPRDSGRGS